EPKVRLADTDSHGGRRTIRKRTGIAIRRLKNRGGDYDWANHGRRGDVIRSICMNDGRRHRHGRHTARLQKIRRERRAVAYPLQLMNIVLKLERNRSDTKNVAIEGDDEGRIVAAIAVKIFRARQN